MKVREEKFRLKLKANKIILLLPAGERAFNEKHAGAKYTTNRDVLIRYAESLKKCYLTPVSNLLLKY